MYSASNFTVERARLQHVPQIAPLFDRYRQFYGQPSDLPGADAFLRNRLEMDQSVIYFACGEEQSKVYGFTQLYPSFSSVSMKRMWILNDLFVDAEFRSLGAGRALLEAARRHAIETGAKGLELATAAGNVRAQRLYEAAGYVKDADFYHYYLSLEEE